MRHILLILLPLLGIAGCAVLGGAVAGGALAGLASGERIAAADGLYEGTGQGYRGPIVVQIRLSAGSIAEIEIVESMEDRFVGGEAMEELLDMVIEYNTTDIDAISGATESSKGFLEAVERAIMKP
jgi:uncharacterized protein with FMN-binding domain